MGIAIENLFHFSSHPPGSEHREASRGQGSDRPEDKVGETLKFFSIFFKLIFNFRELYLSERNAGDDNLYLTDLLPFGLSEIFPQKILKNHIH